jgi:hypothetical protein
MKFEQGENIVCFGRIQILHRIKSFQVIFIQQNMAGKAMKIKVSMIDQTKQQSPSDEEYVFHGHRIIIPIEITGQYSHA